MYLAANKNIDIYNNYSCMNIDEKRYVASVNQFYP